MCGEASSSNIVYQHLARRHQVLAIVEPPLSRLVLLRGRLRKLGVWRVAGQLVFQLGVAPLLYRRSVERRRQIQRDYGLDDGAIPVSARRSVPTVNSPEVIDAVGRFGPDVVVVNGTRILGKRLLEALTVPIVNLHAGITPRYRGVHGAYWALAEGLRELCGVTLHHVDPGIDTGAIIAQATIAPTAIDDFSTYPLLQLAAALRLLDQHLPAIAARAAAVRAPTDAHSVLRYHPTVWEYAVARLSGRAR